MLFTSSTSSLINTSLITSSVLFKIMLVLLSGSAGGILTGFLIKKLDNLVKLCNSAVANILVAIISIVFLGLTFNMYFILGALLIFVSSVAYGYFMIDSSKPKYPASFPNSSIGKLLTKKNILMSMLTLCSVFIVGAVFLSKVPRRNPLSIRCQNGTAHDEAYEAAKSLDKICKDFKLEDAAPNVFHGVVIGGTFKYHHYVSLKSVFKNIKPTAIFIHGGPFDLKNECKFIKKIVFYLNFFSISKGAS